MKSLGKIILIAIFVLPIVICVVVLKNIWSEDTEKENNSNKVSGENILSVSQSVVYQSGDEIISGDDIGKTTSGELREMAGETFETKIGDPISKIYTDASVSSVISNVYSEADEKSELLGRFDKYTTVIAMKFPQGWTRVSGKDSSTGVTISGWSKTDNISFPGDGKGDLNVSTNSSTGVVKADPYLNVRMNPSTTATIVTTVNNGSTVTILESNNGWHKIKTSSGLTGWAKADYIK